MFTKGHTINVGRKNPNAGKKKSPRNLIRAITEALLPDCEAEIAKLALESTNERVRLEACQYIRDCVRGRPHQSQDLRIGKLTPFSGDDYELAMRKVLEEDRKLIEQYGSQEGSQDATKQTGSQGLYEEEKAGFTE